MAKLWESLVKDVFMVLVSQCICYTLIAKLIFYALYHIKLLASNYERNKEM